MSRAPPGRPGEAALAELATHAASRAARVQVDATCASNTHGPSGAFLVPPFRWRTKSRVSAAGRAAAHRPSGLREQLGTFQAVGCVFLGISSLNGRGSGKWWEGRRHKLQHPAPSIRFF